LTAHSSLTSQKGIATMVNAGPSLRERLHFYRVDVFEFVVLTAMCQHDWFGQSIWPSTKRLAAFAKLSRRKTEYVLQALCARGILSKLAPASRGKRKPATYRINEEAFEEDPRMAPYVKRQLPLPGVRIPAVPGEPIPMPTEAKVGPQNMRTPCASVAHTVRICCAHRATDSLKDSLQANTTPKPPASAFQDSIELYFQRAGYATEREVIVPDRGDGSTGRIDLVARRGSEIVAIECDCGRPRRKSEAKLLAFPATQRLIILREPAGGFQQIPAMESLIGVRCRFGRCDGSGVHASYSTPGRIVHCECQEAN
jgi:hypothetical protein